jgi:predicted transcriptional regulator
LLDSSILKNAANGAIRRHVAKRGDQLSMHTHTAKQDALAAIQRLPENVEMEEIMYRLYVLENIRRGREDAAQGKTIPAEELLRDIESW